MKTRTLLLLSLACGVAIMAAGAALLIQLNTADDPVPATMIGVDAAVGDMVVTVERAKEAAGTLAITVTLAGAADDDPSDEFRLIASGRPVAVSQSSCQSMDQAPQTCQLDFDVSTADGTSRVLFYDRGDDGVRWVIAQ